MGTPNRSAGPDIGERISANRALWDGLYRVASIPLWARERNIGPTNLLVLTEDWCGDASNTIPILVRWADESPHAALRLIERDRNPEVMARYLTNGTRSIPIVIVLDRISRSWDTGAPATGSSRSGCSRTG